MDIKKIQKEIVTLENEILIKIQAFELKTSVRVVSIDLDNIINFGKRSRQTAFVDIEVKI